MSRVWREKEERNKGWKEGAEEKVMGRKAGGGFSEARRRIKRASLCPLRTRALEGGDGGR